MRNFNFEFPDSSIFFPIYNGHYLELTVDNIDVKNFLHVDLVTQMLISLCMKIKGIIPLILRNMVFLLRIKGVFPLIS